MPPSSFAHNTARRKVPLCPGCWQGRSVRATFYCSECVGNGHFVSSHDPNSDSFLALRFRLFEAESDAKSAEHASLSRLNSPLQSLQRSVRLKRLVVTNLQSFVKYKQLSLDHCLANADRLRSAIASPFPCQWPCSDDDDDDKRRRIADDSARLACVERELSRRRKLLIVQLFSDVYPVRHATASGIAAQLRAAEIVDCFGLSSTSSKHHSLVYPILPSGIGALKIWRACVWSEAAQSRNPIPAALFYLCRAVSTVCSMLHVHLPPGALTNPIEFAVSPTVDDDILDLFRRQCDTLVAVCQSQALPSEALRHNDLIENLLALISHSELGQSRAYSLSIPAAAAEPIEAAMGQVPSLDVDIHIAADSSPMLDELEDDWEKLSSPAETPSRHMDVPCEASPSTAAIMQTVSDATVSISSWFNSVPK